MTYKQEIVLFLFSFFTILFFIPIFTYKYYAADLIREEAIINRKNTGIVLIDRNGEVFFRFYNALDKKFVPIKSIPKYVQDAVIVAEDKHFYTHPGFSLQSIAAAVLANVKKGDLTYGGSTITQQLVKNSLLTSKKSLLRKYQEIILAYEIERRFTKQKILEMYLNSVYFGEGAFGIASASRIYFNKDVSQLTLGEASLLAGLLSAPAIFSPISGDKEKSKKRQEYVLTQMIEEEMITKKQAEYALKEPWELEIKKNHKEFEAHHFALMVKDYLIKRYGEERVMRSGFRVYTTLDLSWQRDAESVVKEQMTKLEKQGASNSAVVVIDPKTGEIRVLVGSRDWFNNKFGKVNMAQVPRQPGSAFKPIIYSLAFSKRVITPLTLLHDQKTVYEGGYSPQNYDRRFRGSVTVRRALANSLNIPAVEIQRRVGIKETLDFTQKLGITTLGDDPSNYGFSLALGTGSIPLTQLTNVYATFANNGQYNPLTIVTKIIDKNGKTIYEKKDTPQQVIEPGVAFLITSILSDTTARKEVFGNSLNISFPAAVKTGTTDGFRDALTVGYTPYLAIGVWVGNNNNSSMNEVAGSLGAAPIWKQLIKIYHKTLPKVEFAPSKDVVKLTSCKNRYFNNTSRKFSANEEYFLEGTAPSAICYSSLPQFQKIRD